MHLNPVSVGYESIAEVGILTDLADKEKVAEMLKAKPFVKIVGHLGKYDIYAFLQARKLDELSQQVQQIDIKPYVKSVDVLIFADLWNSPWHPENLMIRPTEKEKNLNSVGDKKKFQPILLDDFDKSIAKTLMGDSRTPFNVIAEKLGISTANVIKRYQCLREKNVLNLSTITVDLSKLGYKAIADIFIKVANRGTLPEVEAQLLQLHNATFCAKFVGGAYDLRIAVAITDFNDFSLLKKQIYSMLNIKNAEFYLFENPRYWLKDFVGQDLI
jgi:Lrp/AsnC family transcriptional regulator, leucine-responsive regulatory protein